MKKGKKTKKDKPQILQIETDAAKEKRHLSGPWEGVKP